MYGTGCTTIRGALVPLLLFLGLLCMVAVSCEVVGGGEVACAALPPEVEAEPAQAAPNEAFWLRGEGFADYSNRGGPGGSPQGECP